MIFNSNVHCVLKPIYSSDILTVIHKHQDVRNKDHRLKSFALMLFYGLYFDKIKFVL